MNRDKRRFLLIITLVNAWSLLFPFYGPVFEKMVSRSGNDFMTAKTICLTIYMVSLFLFMFIIDKKSVGRLLSISLVSLVLISALLWYVPKTQNYYTYSVIGILSGMAKAPIYYFFIYGFKTENRERAVGIFLFGTYFFAYIYKFISLVVNDNIIFIGTTLLLAAVCALSFKYNQDELVPQSSIAEKPFPVKLTLVLGVLYLIAFFCNGMLVNNVYPRMMVSVKGAMFYLELLPQLVIYLVVAFLGRRVNLFVLLNTSIVFMGAACLSYIIWGGNNIVTNVVIDISYSMFDVFMYCIWGDISLKYGRNPKVRSVILLFTVLGTAIGEFASVKVTFYSGGITGAVPIIIISSLFICVSLTPWLIKCIGESLSNSLSIQNHSEHAIHEIAAPAGTRRAQTNNEPGEKKDSSHGPEVSAFSVSTADETNYKWMTELIGVNNQLTDSSKLTRREMDIAVYLLQRYDYNTIANELFISVNTLKVHVKHIYQKLQVSSKNEFISAVDTLIKQSCRP